MATKTSKKTAKKLATKKITPMTKKPAKKVPASVIKKRDEIVKNAVTTAKKATKSKDPVVQAVGKVALKQLGEHGHGPLSKHSDAFQSMQNFLTKGERPTPKKEGSLVIPAGVKTGQGAYTICKTERCLACHNLASATTDPDDETTIVCGFEIRAAGVIEDDDEDHECQMFVMRPDAPQAVNVSTAQGLGSEDEEDADDEQPDDAAPDFEAMAKIEKYAFVGDLLARVEHPKASQKTYDLTVGFVEEYNMTVQKLKTELAKKHGQEDADLANQLLQAKQMVIGDPDDAQSQGVKMLLGLASADGLVGDDDDDIELEDLAEFEDEEDEDEFIDEEEEEDDEDED